MKLRTKIKTVALAASFTVLAGSAQAQLTDGLLNYWPLDGNGEDTASDYQGVASTTEDDGVEGSDNDGNGGGVVSYTEGKFDDALTLDGDAHLAITDAGDAGAIANDTDRTGSDLTISAWIKVDSFTEGWQGVIAHGEQSDYRIGRLQTGNNLSYAGGTNDLRGGISVNDGEWHHVVAITTNGVGTKLYIDGGLDQETSNGATAIAASNDPLDVLWIGGNPNAGREFDGQIDDVAMWNRPLSANEVSDIFNAGSSLKALLSTDDSDGDGLPDGWEEAYSLDPNDATGANGADGDPDMDTLTNLAEYNGGVLATDPNNADTDGDTLRDDYETRDGIFVSATQTGTSPILRDTDDDGLDDNVEDGEGTFISAVQTGSNPNLADTDSDTMPDNYEVNNLLDPNTDDTLLDPDADNLSNLSEFTRGTNPQKADTDDDFSNDDVEIANMTDPLVPDTDNDGILDGHETNNGLQSYVSPTDTGTDPLVADTDLDGFNDGAEIAVGTDPTDINSLPPATSLPIFDDFEDNALDQVTWKSITGTVPQDNSSTAFGGSISEEEGNLKLGSRGYLFTATEYDPELVGGLEITGEITLLTTQDVISILTRSDAVPSSYYGEATSGVRFQLNGNGDTIGIAARNEDEDLYTVENAVVVGTIDFQANVVYTFTIIDDGEGSLSMVVTDRDTPENTISVTADLTGDFSDSNSVVIHNREGNRSSDLHQIEIKSHFGPDSNEIQSITYDEANDQFTLTWDSRAGTNYDLFASVDLTDFTFEVTDGIAGEEGTTSYTFDHPAPGSEKLFFRVEALPTE